MDAAPTHFTLTTSFVFLLLGLLETSRGDICSGPVSVNMRENNRVGDLVATLTAQPGVTMRVQPPADAMLTLRGNQLFAAQVFDFETQSRIVVKIDCLAPDGLQTTFVIVLILENVNEHAPVFGQSLYNVDVSEMASIGTSVGRYIAVDADQTTRLFYTLRSDLTSFRLRSAEEPDLIVNSVLDYDTVPHIRMVLEAQDTSPTTPDSTTISLTGTTTIVVTIQDADNRPPWFLPCTKHTLGSTVVCTNAGYNGSVDLNETLTGVLPLNPGPLYATDGDFGINEAITYSILSGNDQGLFQINANTGNISMLKPALSLDTISLGVLAAQSRSPHQFAVTTVTVTVRVKSLHPPRFQKPSYAGVVSGTGTMATDEDGPLYIHATDADYNEIPNPYLVYTIDGSSDFALLNGYLFMTRDLPPSNLSLRVAVRDTTNDQSDTAALRVEVKSGLTTTTSLPNTTVITTTTPTTINTTPEGTTHPTTNITPDGTTPTTINTTPDGTSNPTTNINTTPDGTSNPTTNINTTPDGTSNPTTNINTTPDGTINPTTNINTTPDGTSNPTTNINTTPDGTTHPTTNINTTPKGTLHPTTHLSTSAPTEGSAPTSSSPSGTTDGGATTTGTAHPPTVIVQVGGYGPEDMGALGATLGVLLFVSLLVIGLLVYSRRKGKADWKKLHEVSVFRSTLGQGSGGLKAGVQYTNEAFQGDEDGGSVGSGGPQGGTAAQVKSPPPPNVPPPDDGSEAGSDKGDDEREVRPILTKERRTEEGYKAVWFKEDIDPNAKEEVVIIPDRRGEDSEEEEEVGPDHNTSSVSFDDTDLDSGLGVKMGDVPDDSDNDGEMTSDL